MFNPSIPKESIDSQATSTDGRVTLCANGHTHMFGRKVVIKNNGGLLNIKKQNQIFFLFLPKAVFEHVYISTRTLLSLCLRLC
jgi:hypothetical protein